MATRMTDQAVLCINCGKNMAVPAVKDSLPLWMVDLKLHEACPLCLKRLANNEEKLAQMYARWIETRPK